MDLIDNQDENKEELKQQRENLKQRAAMLGITFAQNTSSAKIAELIEQHLVSGSGTVVAQDEEPSTDETPQKPKPVGDFRQELRKNALKLVRVRVTCHNPNKQQIEGEFFTVGNKFIGTVSRYVPFGEKTDSGYHIEQCIYDHMVNRTYLHIDSREDRRTKRITVKTKDAKEFTLEVLPPLSKEELKVLGNDQRVRGAVDE